MPLKTPICDFGQAAKSFELKSTNNEIIKLNDVKGTNGTLVMFICNHCPYVKVVIKDIVEDSFEYPANFKSKAFISMLLKLFGGKYSNVL